MLNLAIYSLLEFRHDSLIAVRQLDQLAQQHARLGLEPRHYDLFLKAFMKTLVDYESDALGLEAWRSTLANGIKFMLGCVKTTESE